MKQEYRPCACGGLRHRKARRCRSCWTADKSSLGQNSFAKRPELLAKAVAAKTPCPICSRPIRASALAMHQAAHDQWRKIDASGDCWEWLGSLSDGYGKASPANERQQAAHRWVWTQLVGPIPAGMQLDHLCRNRRCVNPDHLEVVTGVENRRRGFSPSQIAYRRRLGVRQIERGAA